MAQINPQDLIEGPRTQLELGGPGYPSQLAGIADAPRQLNITGNPQALQPGIAIVGARKATAYGLACAKRFAGIAAQLGVPVVSGGAIGCDQAAHTGALDFGGTTVVVLGSGANVVYPRRAKGLFETVLARGGALVSEMPWDSPPQKWAFRKRNRIIAGLARAVLIVEAGLPSGTFSTADYALESGKEVLVVPGSIFSRESFGSNTLIREGATPIIDDSSFVHEMGRIFGVDTVEEGQTPSLFDNLPPTLTTQQSKIVGMLAANPQTPDQIVDSTHGTLLDVLRQLSLLETLGVVAKYPDGRFGIAQDVLAKRG